MPKTKVLLFLPILCSVILSSCIDYDSPEPRIQPPAETTGWTPIYGNWDSATIIKSTAPTDIVKGGKIYIKNDTLYQVENGKGIHVIYIGQPAAPQKIKFIEIMGCQEMAIMDHYLYTNNLNDLVVVNISDLNNVTEADRIANTFHLVDPYQPPGAGWYECPDASKGDVIGWELKTIYNPKCSH